MRKKVCTLIACLILVIDLSGCDPYSDLLKKQGYKMLSHPRGDFGTGTIIKPLTGNAQLFVAAPEECFPGIVNVIHPDAIKLVDSKQQKNLSVDIGAKYLPASPVTIAAAFGSKTVKNLDVSFGETTANDVTVETLAKFFDGKKISKRCVDYLKNDANNLIVSAVQVKSMNYTFKWDTAVNANVDVGALKDTLKANGVVSYSVTGTNTLTITQPMYIAYTAFKFADLGIPTAEFEGSGGGDLEIKKPKVVKVDVVPGIS